MDDESTLEIDKFGNKFWKNKEGLLHRLDGPALEWPGGGGKRWYENGLLHRLDGPAYTTNSGYKQWRFRGSIHREDGPAIIYATGGKEWWVDGIKYKTKEDYFNALSDEAKMKCLFSEDFLNG